MFPPRHPFSIERFFSESRIIGKKNIENVRTRIICEIKGTVTLMHEANRKEVVLKCKRS